MKTFLNNEKGGIVLLAVALIAVVVSLLSTISLLGIVQTDHLQTQYQNDMLQEEFLLRSEAKRTHLSLEYNKYRPLPDRIVQIESDNRLTTFNIDNKKEMTTISSFMGFASQEAVAIRTLITAKRARSFVIDIESKSPVRRFSERLMRNESLAQFQYFSHIEESENADGGAAAAMVRFYGADELWGPVHSNDDIWIRELYGWPTFHAMVTTAGRIMDYDTNQPAIYSAPMDEIFLVGFQEEVPAIIYTPTADDIRAHGHWLFGDPDPEIVYVKIDGSSFTSWYGDIQLVGYEDFDVYSWYPMNAVQAENIIAAGGNWFEDSDVVWTNQIAIYDTIWSPGPANFISNSSVFVDKQQLWIEGHITGKQTWGCADTIFIVGDIYYDGTTKGDPPDEDPINLSDYFGLVSEKKIIIRYKNIDPFENFSINTENCNDIYLYGAYAAIGRGDENIFGSLVCKHDGIFTFQYHHGHGSTPDFWAQSPYTFQETLYTYIDFHKFIYPHSPFVPPNIEGFNMHGGAPVAPYNTCGYPFESPAYVSSYPNDNPSAYVFPYVTGWPWYNPVWPESAANIVFLRGYIHMFGAIAQTRRGFVRRSGSDPYNHPYGGSNPSPWDIDNYHYDGNHPPAGYDKDYHYDNRFLYVQPPDYPEIYRGWGASTLSSFSEEAWSLKVPPI